MATNAVSLATLFEVKPQYAAGNFATAVFDVDATALTLFSTGNTDNVTVANLPAGMLVLGASLEVVTPATNATGTCTGKVIVGGASGTDMNATAGDVKAAAGTAYAGTAGLIAAAHVTTAATTLVLQFATATAPNTVNPKVRVKLFLAK
jgi:hypothetical protein